MCKQKLGYYQDDFWLQYVFRLARAGPCSRNKYSRPAPIHFRLVGPETLLKIWIHRLNRYFFGYFDDWRLGGPRPNAAPSRRPQCCGGHNSLLLLEAAKAKGEESKEKRRNGKRRSNTHVCVCCFYCETLVCVNAESVAGMWYTSKPVHNLTVCWQVVYTG